MAVCPRHCQRCWQNVVAAVAVVAVVAGADVAEDDDGNDVPEEEEDLLSGAEYRDSAGGHVLQRQGDLGGGCGGDLTSVATPATPCVEAAPTRESHRGEGDGGTARYISL